jgi:hypothetical protein
MRHLRHRNSSCGLRPRPALAGRGSAGLGDRYRPSRKAWLGPSLPTVPGRPEWTDGCRRRRSAGVEQASSLKAKSADRHIHGVRPRPVPHLLDRGLVVHPKDLQGRHRIPWPPRWQQRGLLGALTLKLCGIAKCRPRRHTGLRTARSPPRPTSRGPTTRRSHFATGPTLRPGVPNSHQRAPTGRWQRRFPYQTQQRSRLVSGPCCSRV